MQVEFDLAKCTGHGLCESTPEDVFEGQDDGSVEIQSHDRLVADRMRMLMRMRMRMRMRRHPVPGSGTSTAGLRMSAARRCAEGSRWKASSGPLRRSRTWKPLLR